MKTVIIYEEIEQPIKFFVLEGDYSHLKNVFINSMDSSQELIDELSNLLYDNETGKDKLPSFTDFPLDLVKSEPEVKVIVCGFLP